MGCVSHLKKCPFVRAKSSRPARVRNIALQASVSTPGHHFASSVVEPVSPLERLVVDSWTDCPRETRDAVFTAIREAFGCVSTVEILASSTEEDLDELYQKMKGLGIAHASLFRYAIAGARQWLPSQDDFQSARSDAGGGRRGRQPAELSRSRSRSPTRHSTTLTRPRSSTPCSSG